MPGDAGDKTEAPTPRRREEARKKGQIARSQDLSSSILLLGGMVCLRWFGPRLIESLTGSLRHYMEMSDAREAMHIDVVPMTLSLAAGVIGAAGPIMVGLLLLSVASHLVQVGFVMTTDPLTPNLNKLNPVNGFQRLLSMRTIVQLAMNMLKLTFVGLVGYVIIAERIGKVFLAMEVGGWAQLALMAQILYEIGLILAVVLFVLALTDYVWQRWRHEQDIKMTKEEVKEELRRMEGDPIIKQRRRKMQLAAALMHIRKNVPKADVIVTNPTELAIAIKYDAEAMVAPRVIAKGQDYLAAKIRQIAVQHGIPIVERKPLAQALFKTVEVGQEVPEQFYKAIAEILAYVYELNGKARNMRRAPAA
ncbi:flagellar biosynthesis protein FlhB [cyanobacterium TDX16]|nr:flagellar biosynthesis protein FlhB [cyanobacterium TDX16]